MNILPPLPAVPGWLSRTYAVMNKEFIQVIRDRRTLSIILGLPTIQLLILGSSIEITVDHMKAIVYDESETPESRRFLAAVENTTYFDVTRTAQTKAEALRAIDDGSAKAAFIIPPDFGKNVLRGELGRAQILVDGSDPNFANTAVLAGTGAGQNQSAEVMVEHARRAGRTVPEGGLSPFDTGVDVRPTVLYNPSVRSVNFMVPGLIGTIMLFQTMVLTASAIVRERERGNLEQLMVSPIKSIELMLGKIIPYVVLAFIASALSLIVGQYVFDVPIVGSIPLLIGLSLLFLGSSLGTGLFISTISTTERQAMQISVFLLMPAMLLSGFAFSRENMPWIANTSGLLIPLTHYLVILRGIILKGVGLDVLWPETIWLTVMGVGLLVFSANRFQKRIG